MKISGLTIFLIPVTLMTLFSFYTDHKILKMWEDTCNKINPAPMDQDISENMLKSIPQERWDLWESCMQQQSYYRLKDWLMFFVSPIFIVLTVLSLKVDYLKKRSFLEPKKKK